jgi:hypothetical protein
LYQRRLVLISGDAVGHLLNISMNQVAPVLLGVVGGADSLRHDATVKAIYLALVAGEDVLHIVHAILVQVGWQFFQDIGELVKNEDITAHLFLLRRVEGAQTGVLY